jgi:hypothetical protein
VLLDFHFVLLEQLPDRVNPADRFLKFTLSDANVVAPQVVFFQPVGVVGVHLPMCGYFHGYVPSRKFPAWASFAAADSAHP